MVVPLITWGYLAYYAGLLVVYGLPDDCRFIALVTGAMIVVWRTTLVTIGCACACLAGIIMAITSPPIARYAASANQSSASFLDRQRLRAGATIDTVFREDAPLARALLVADQDQIPKEIKLRYADAGIVHMLSISGLHVAIIATAIELVFHLARLPTRTASAAAVAIIIVYVAMLGWPPPAVRSGVMLAVVSATRAFQRPTSRWAALACGGLIPLLIDPRTAIDLGYQLSVGGIAGLIASGALAKRIIPKTLKGWRSDITRGLLASSVATVVSAPLVAWAFGRISLIAPLTNLVADPIVALAQPILFLALIAAPLRPFALFIADAAHPLLLLFDHIATLGASIPYAAIAVAPSQTSILCSGIASAALISACVSRFPGRALVVAAGAGCAVVWTA